MNPRLNELQPYPFTRLRELFADLSPVPGKAAVSLGMGEPQHASPDFVLQAITDNLSQLAKYPTTPGTLELRSSIADWLQRRFKLDRIDPAEQVLPVNGTREALFAFAQAVVTPGEDALVLSPNPFYQIYEGAALLAGATPRFINCTSDNGFLPEFDAVTEDEWRRCQLLYLCSPGNPTGAVMPIEQLQDLIAKARECNFIIASDECYSEIYFDESAPPPGLLQACAALGDSDYSNCVVFHSLSKRSNLPGLRSGFVAGDARALQAFLQYRTYHGCAMPVHHQLASIAAWDDEEHVAANRDLYRAKFDVVLDIFDGVLDVHRPDAGFYLWPKTPISDTEFARRLYQDQAVTVLPGRFLARDTHPLNPAGSLPQDTHPMNPGENRVRMALVATIDDCVEAATRVAECATALKG